MIVVREAYVEDIPDLRQVAISSFVDAFTEFNSPKNMSAYIEEAYSHNKLMSEFDELKSKLLLACEGDNVIGFVRLRENKEVNDVLGDHAIELQRLYVLTEAQGKSVGKLLMENALLYAKNQKYQWIWLGVWERNFRAQKFYEHWGFEKFSEHTFWMGDDPQIDWLLKRKL